MMPDLMDRSRLELLNRKGLKYGLADAEKDYMLAVVLKLIFSSALAQRMVFKGGTALYHCYLKQTRFSSDLDFTASVTMEEFSALFSGNERLKIKETVSKKFGYDLVLQYTGPLEFPNSIFVNVNTNQKVLLKTKRLKYINNYGLDFICAVLDEKEIFAEKIRTLNERTKPRDYYDLAMLKRYYKIELAECLALAKRKELHIPLSKEHMLKNIKLTMTAYEREMNELYYGEEVKKEEVELLAKEIAGLI
ncbi:MAG: nucleotidyl transferase AbiEii/AbiGii toxin family protein [Candidatus Firestonebacteria bacterium]